MSAWRPELNTLEQVLAYYENSNYTRYKVYAGNKPEINSLRWEFDGDDKNEGLHELEQALKSILANPLNINSYTLQILRSDAVFKTNESKTAKKIQDAINIVFQLNMGGAIQPYNPQQQMAGTNSRLESLMEKMLEQNAMLMSKLAAQELLEDEEEQIGEMPNDNPIMGLLQNPRLQEMLIDKLAGLFETKKPTAMAGITQTAPAPANHVFSFEQIETINAALLVLNNNVEDLPVVLAKLADYSEQHPTKFKLYLQML